MYYSYTVLVLWLTPSSHRTVSQTTYGHFYFISYLEVWCLYVEYVDHVVSTRADPALNKRGGSCVGVRKLGGQDACPTPPEKNVILAFCAFL